jgi:uncharacterized RDD family membrane protein YckC
MQPDERLRIDTPEQVALELPVAGIGSRFLAVAVDTVLQVVLFLAAVAAFVVLPARTTALSFVGYAGPAITILFTFCVYWGYFAFFEILWNGRTPGKRVAGIRVIKESGRPINAYEAIGRNVLRAIDFLPAMYGLGVVVMMLNRQSRRIGDFVAGTVVVHDRGVRPVKPNWAAVAPVPGGSHSLVRVTAEELTLIETYLHRRAELDPDVGVRMAQQIASRIAERTGLRLDASQTVDEFLEGVARRTRDTARLR